MGEHDSKKSKKEGGGASAYIGAIFVLVFGITLGWEARYVVDHVVEKVVTCLEDSAQVDFRGKKVALGYNTNLDLVVQASDVMQRLELDSADKVEAHRASSGQEGGIGKDVEEIRTLDDFFSSFLYHASRGIAGERYVSSPSVFDAIIAASTSSPSAKYAVGGNAAIMSLRLHELGGNILLGGPIGGRLRSLLPTTSFTLSSPTSLASSFSSSSSSSSSSSTFDKDEIHLIIEYEKGYGIEGTFSSPRANRYIVVRDETNARLAALEPFHTYIQRGYFNADAIVFSGLHLLTSLRNSERDLRLETFKNTIESIGAAPSSSSSSSPSSYLHLELASMADEKYARQLASGVFKAVHSIGLNEQELAYIYEATTGDSSLTKVLTGKVPSIRAVTKALDSLLSTYSCESGCKLERIHFHSLAYHVIALTTRVVDDKVGGEEGGDTKGNAAERGVALGSLTASKRACGIEMNAGISSPSNVKKLDMLVASDIGADRAGLKPTFVRGIAGVVRWETKQTVLFGAPVAVCKKPVGTVGLGDFISASGLAGQLGEKKK